MIQQLYRLVLDRRSKEDLREELRTVGRDAANAVEREFDGTGREIADEVAEGGKGFDDVSASARRSAAKSEGFFKRTARSIKGFFNETAKGMLAGFATLFAVQRVAAFSQELYRLGVSAEETASKFATTFGEARGEVDRFIESQANMIGLSRDQARNMSATAAAIVQGMGMSQDASAGFSTSILELAGDLQSFHDVPIEETFAAIRSGLTGEQEPLKRFGIVLSQADTEMKALEQTGKRTAKELSQQELAVARLTLMYEKAGPAIGDVGRTSESTANQQRQLMAWWVDTKREIGEGLVPALGSVVKWLNANKDSIKETGGAIGAVLLPPLKFLLALVWDLSRALVGALAMAVGAVTISFAKLVEAMAGANEAVARFYDWIGADERARRVRDQASEMRELAAAARDIGDAALETSNKLHQAVTGGSALASLFGAGGGAAAPGADGAGAGGGGGGAGGGGGGAPTVPARTAPAVTMPGRIVVDNTIATIDQGVLEGLAAARAARLAGIAQAMIHARDVMRGELEVPAIITRVEIPDRQRVLEPLEALQRDMITLFGTDVAEQVWGELATASAGIAGGIYDAFSNAFELIKEEGATARDVLASAWKGLAAAVLGELSQIARARAVEAGAEALMNLAGGFARSALGDAAGAAAHFTAAKTYGLAALKWGAAGIAMGALSPGGAGGHGYKGSQPVGGRAAEGVQRLGPEVHIYLDPLDPSNPAYARNVAAAGQLAKELYGSESNVTVHSRTGG